MPTPTIENLTRNPGPYISAFLPVLTELATTNDPYLTNEAAFIIRHYQDTWGAYQEGVNTFGNIGAASRSQQVKYTGRPELRNAAESALLANFRVNLETMDKTAPNSWSDFQLFVELFYLMLDPITFFNTAEFGALDQYECPPDYTEPCPDGINFWSDRIGMVRRPYEDGEGTGFYINGEVEGDVTTEYEFGIGYRAPFPYTEPHALALNNRYIVLNTDGATGADDIIWFDYEGTGVQPVVTGNGGTQTFYSVELNSNDEWPSIQAKTDAIIEATGNWVKAAGGIAVCYDKKTPPAPKCTECDNCDGCAKVITCPFKFSSRFVAAAVGPRIEARDGDGGYQTPITDMKDSTGSIVASGLVTDKDWETAHNTILVPAEEALGNKIKYIKMLDYECPLCPPERELAGYFLQSDWKMVPWVIARNANSGVVNFRTRLNDRSKVMYTV